MEIKYNQNIIERCAGGKEHQLSENVSIKKQGSDVNIYYKNRLMAWMRNDGWVNSFDIESEEADWLTQEIFDEVTEVVNSYTGNKDIKIGPGLQPAPDLTERKLGYLQGQVDVYERLISGGFTNLSK